MTRQVFIFVVCICCPVYLLGVLPHGDSCTLLGISQVDAQEAEEVEEKKTVKKRRPLLVEAEKQQHGAKSG